MIQTIPLKPVKPQYVTCSICKQEVKHPLSCMKHNHKKTSFMTRYFGSETDIKEFLTLTERDFLEYGVCEECQLLIRG